MDRINRRSFMKGTIAATAGVSSMLSASSWANVSGANEEIRVAICGLNSRGKSHIKAFKNMPGVKLVALCDPDTAVLDARLKDLNKPTEPVEGEPVVEKPNIKVDTYQDVRKVLDRKDIDAIVIVTPNHWHSLMTIWGCQAGKDVYVEKPLSHNIFEGRKAVEAARKYKRIVQVGTQNRSDDGLIPAYKYIHEGKIGKIKYVHGLCYKRRKSIGKVAGPQAIPGTVDYDLWTGPAPLEPLMREKLHYDWHWVWPTGNGDIGNQGIHEMDLCRWAIGDPGLPKRVMSIGGRFGYEDDATTPNTMITFYDYEPAPIIFEVRGLPMRKGMEGMDNLKGIRVGVVIQCENGYFAGGRNGGYIYSNSGEKLEKFGGEGGGTHQQNFIDAMRSRNVSDLRADVEQGHISTALCHLGNISYQLGTNTDVKEIPNIVKDTPQAPESWKRMQEHLFQNWVDLSAAGVKVGPWLETVPGKERFKETGPYSTGTFANGMLTRNYRKPFIVPDKV